MGWGEESVDLLLGEEKVDDFQLWYVKRVSESGYGHVSVAHL